MIVVSVITQLHLTAVIICLILTPQDNCFSTLLSTVVVIQSILNIGTLY